MNSNVSASFKTQLYETIIILDEYLFTNRWGYIAREMKQNSDCFLHKQLIASMLTQWGEGVYQQSING
jgi:hypothetical protein